MPLLKFWVKWEGEERPEKFVCQHLDEFWHTLREHFLRRQRIPEWIIRTYE